MSEKIPVYYDLLRNFRRQYGPSIISHITIDSLYEGLNNVKTIVRETSEINPKHGVIIARYPEIFLYFYFSFSFHV